MRMRPLGSAFRNAQAGCRNDSSAWPRRCRSRCCRTISISCVLSMSSCRVMPGSTWPPSGCPAFGRGRRLAPSSVRDRDPVPEDSGLKRLRPGCVYRDRVFRDQVAHVFGVLWIRNRIGKARDFGVRRVFRVTPSEPRSASPTPGPTTTCDEESLFYIPIQSS